MKQYVLVSQGLEILRTTDEAEAKRIMNRENEDWLKYKYECMENNEPYVDNYIEMFEEE